MDAIEPKAVLPPPLRRGDTVAVVAPAGPPPADKLRAGLEVIGARYDVRCDLDALLTRTGYLAGDDDRRADELNRALADSDVRAIFVARGGYGTMRILDRLDAAALRADPRPIVGFSDATALLAWAMTEAGICGVHGPVLTQLGELPADDHAALFACLEAPARPDLSGLGAPDAPVVGGNLSLVAHLAGTRYRVPTAGALLLLEDLGERPYAIDRYLTGLALAGALDGARGVILGDFTDCDEKRGDPDPDVWAVLAERLETFELPWWRGAPIGHGARNRALWLGC